MIDFRPLILTARPEASALARFETLRQRHFPAERNRVPAHISMFHQLPGSEYAAVVERLRLAARERPTPMVEVVGVRSLGRGVAFKLRSAGLEALHRDLAEAWAPLLIPQDRNRFAAHVTVQNKVTPQLARETLETLSAGFQPWTFRIVAIDVWRYLDGPWEALRSVALLA